MKIFFDWCHIFKGDYDVKFGINWYKHHRDHKWKGFTITIYLLFWLVSVNFVDNYEEYDKRINRHRYRKLKKNSDK